MTLGELESYPSKVGESDGSWVWEREGMMIEEGGGDGEVREGRRVGRWE